jgi:NADH:ubiquinone oxidoreductase subunit 5 (subunit L)/multisubunit Na+/H+ antiporter MnhA subunit
MEAPTSVSALLHAATMVKASVYLIARLILIIGPLAVTIPLWLPSIAWVGVLSAFVGATMAFYTRDIKGVLAYSTISQLGFMIAALGSVTAAAAASLGWFASLFHMMSHAFFEGLGFLLAGGIIHALGTRDMRLMGGLKKAMPITFALLFVFIIYAALTATFAYTLRFIILVFMRKPSELIRQSHIHESSKTMLFSAGILAILCFVWGFLANSIAAFLEGYVLFGLSLFSSPVAIVGVVLHLVNHAVSKGLLFFSAGAVAKQVETRDVTKVGGLAWQMPVTAVCTTIGALSIAGIPPFGFFISELLIFIGAFETIGGDGFYFVPTALMFVVVVLSLAYVLRYLGHIFFGSRKLEKVKEIPFLMKVAMVVLAVIVVVIFLWPSFFIDIIGTVRLV